MKKSLILLGLLLLIFGAALGFHASQRNCLVAFITEGRMNFWTTMEIVGGLLALAGILIVLVGLVKKT